MSYDRTWSEYVGEMHTTTAEQYGINCVVVFQDRYTADEVIEHARKMGATFPNGSDGEGEEFCVALRPEVGPELWSEESLRRSIEQRRVTT